MPKYFPFKIADHYLYFTSQCIVEAMHVHASDRRVTDRFEEIREVIQNEDHSI